MGMTASPPTGSLRPAGGRCCKWCAADGRALVAQALPPSKPPVAGPVASVVVLCVVIAEACWLGSRLLSRVELP
jgi:hypothetical protein